MISSTSFSSLVLMFFRKTNYTHISYLPNNLEEFWPCKFDVKNWELTKIYILLTITSTQGPLLER